MAGTSRPDGVPNDWVSSAEFEWQLDAMGCTVPASRVAKWREVGLVPSPQQPATYDESGRVFGSEVWHPPKAALHVLATERAMAAKSLFDFAGTILWMAGAEVPQLYWRPRLLKADAYLRQMRRKVRLLVREDASAKVTFGERAVSTLDRVTGVMAKIERQVPGQLPFVINVGAEIVAGDFESLGTHHHEKESSDLELAEQALNLGAGRTDSIHGVKFNFIDGLSQALSEVSASLGQYDLNDFSDDEIKAARDDLRNGFKLAVCHYEAMRWMYGDKAFGLRMVSFIGSTVSIDGFFLWVALFVRLRRYADHFHTTEEIKALAHQAELTWLTSTYFRDLQSDPKFRDSIQSNRWKRAFKDSNEFKKLVDELAGYPWPAPDFRPWDQWKKLSRKTMSPGLLAMSIGAPSQISVGAILRGVNGAPHP